MSSIATVREMEKRPGSPIMPFGVDDQHIISASQFVPEALPVLFSEADVLYGMDNDFDGRRELAQRHLGRRACSLFYEPSTRTRLSFETAAVTIGMAIVSTENAKEFSSAAKGETIEDTIRNLDQYGFDAVWIRHDQSGSLAKAAAVAETPVINAGDGSGEHPTQSLLDAYTIHREWGKLDGLNVVMGGDLRYGRTVRSLSRLLSKYPGNKFTYVSYPDFSIGEDVKDELRQDGTPFAETDEVVEALEGADVVYWTRSQKERHGRKTGLDKMIHQAQQIGKDALTRYVPGLVAPQTTNGLILNERTIAKLPESGRILHPLPRVDEISTDIDNDPRSIWFKQAGNGLYLRMALLDRIAVKS